MKKLFAITLLVAGLLVTNYSAQAQNGRAKTSVNSSLQSQDQNQHVEVIFWQYTAYSNYAGYYVIVNNNTPDEMYMTLTSDLFAEQVLILPGQNTVWLGQGQSLPYVDGLKIKCAVHDAGYNFSLHINAGGYN